MNYTPGGLCRFTCPGWQAVGRSRSAAARPLAPAVLTEGCGCPAASPQGNLNHFPASAMKKGIQYPSFGAQYSSSNGASHGRDIGRLKSRHTGCSAAQPDDWLPLMRIRPGRTAGPRFKPSDAVVPGESNGKFRPDASGHGRDGRQRSTPCFVRIYRNMGHTAYGLS